MAKKAKSAEKSPTPEPFAALPTPASAAKKKKSTKPKGKKASVPPATKPRRTATAAPVAPPTDDEIQLRAYFISERRRRLALPGDASSDWLEARRQLMAEMGA